MELSTHPRLFATPDDMDHIQERFNADSPVAKGMWRAYSDSAAAATADADVPHQSSGHNWHLVRARHLQTHLLTAIVEYLRTSDDRIRPLIVEYLQLLAGWDYWSWIDWRSRTPEPEDTYDLSFGEIGLTLAATWDWLSDELSADERDLIEQLAGRHLSAYVRVYDEGGWWSDRPYSNWTAVTNGGAGMLALSMWEELEDPAGILERVESAMEVFFGEIHEDGGWPEGVGYWNYGMRYGFLYLLSHESATGEKHPLFAHPGVQNTAVFPLLFSPYGQGAGFGDVNNFAPMPFHYRVLDRINRREWWPVLDSITVDQDAFAHKNWPRPAFYGLLGPQARQEPSRIDTPDNRLLEGIKWGYLSEGMPDPETYISVRGGTCQVPHAHTDLMAFWFQADGEHLLINAADEIYLDTTFSEYRQELYGCRSQSKNTILLNGIGVRPDATSATRAFQHDGHFGIHVDCSDCFGDVGRFGDWVSHCSRSFLNLGDGRYLITDRVEFEDEGEFEARFHTRANVHIQQRGVIRIDGESCALKLRTWADDPISAHLARSAPIVPETRSDTIIQVQSEALVKSLTMVTLLELSQSVAPLECEGMEDHIAVMCDGEEICVVPVGEEGVPFGDAL